MPVLRLLRVLGPYSYAGTSTGVRKKSDGLKPAKAAEPAFPLRHFCCGQPCQNARLLLGFSLRATSGQQCIIKLAIACSGKQELKCRLTFLYAYAGEPDRPIAFRRVGGQLRLTARLGRSNSEAGPNGRASGAAAGQQPSVPHEFTGRAG
jgi:hypothetical protein